MDWSPYIAIGVSSLLTVAGVFFMRTMNTLSKHTITLTQLVEQLKPIEQLRNELTDIRVTQAVLKNQVDSISRKLAQTE